MKIFKEYVGDFNVRNKQSEDDLTNIHYDPSCPQKNFVIKVSGIWENYEEIGLTFKLMEQGNTFTTL
jgi:hypothetical protein